ncbi:hypothetical protein V0R50_17950 [Pseudomonas sp. 148P]|uniref:Secreted protein n=1 Tax=Pseudomonas ulcerans TaxID=3115852 RepID=A0ABU7HU90_9PSED|nr:MULTISPECIES: hypothetical protein [unclassified Pseudomonas]MEE1923940.1 hypothetical protein [Pseudomonas sp. 147P]MEE1935117.1 hypothetical protein [Pseudomonas sp. 148P]
MKYLALPLAAALLAFSQASSADPVDEQWRTLISKDFKEGCIIRLKSYLESNGLNGRRGATWFVESCDGRFEYSTSYLPAPRASEDSPLLVAKRVRQLPPVTP